MPVENDCPRSSMIDHIKVFPCKTSDLVSSQRFGQIATELTVGAEKHYSHDANDDK